MLLTFDIKEMECCCRISTSWPGINRVSIFCRGHLISSVAERSVWSRARFPSVEVVTKNVRCPLLMFSGEERRLGMDMGKRQRLTRLYSAAEAGVS
jgi:hypothetical protein